jgi:AcrR family transcriptional regulator
MARPAVAAERRAQILDAMYDVIAEHGLAGASVTDIAEAAGVARGALHYFFANKDELESSLMRRLGEQYVSRLAGAVELRKHNGGGKRYVAHAAGWHFRGDDASLKETMAVWIDFWAHAGNSPALRAVVLEVQEGARGVFKRALLLDRPELADMPPVELRHHAAALLAIVEGALLQWRVAEGTGAPLDRKILGESVAAAVHAAARAIGPQKLGRRPRASKKEAA